jgi:hypothetical protein
LFTCVPQKNWRARLVYAMQLGLGLLELGVAFMFLGQLEQAEIALTEAMEIFRELDQSPRVLSCLHNLAIIQMEMGNLTLP